MRTAFLAAVLLAAAPLARAEAPPDDTAAARARFRAATALFKAGNYREAAAEFEAAYRLRPHGSIHFNVAQCRERLGEWPAAYRAYSDYLREVPDAPDRAAVRAAMKRLEEKLAATGIQVLLVYTEPPGADVRIEGRVRGRTPFHLALPPGAYALHLSREGVAPLEREVTIPPDASVTVDAVLPKLAAPASSLGAAPAALAPGSGTAGGEERPGLAVAPAGEAPQPAPRVKGRVWTWVAAGAAVVAASAGAYYGIEARDAESTLRDGKFHPDARALADDAKKKARTANVLYGVAGAAAAAGVTLFVVEGRF